MRPLTLAPVQRKPTSEWMRKAKSRALAPAGSWNTSPPGLKTKTSSRRKSLISVSMYSRGSATSSCQAMI